MENVENRVYFTLKDGTIINDEYANKTVKEFDEAIRSGKAVVEPNPHCIEALQVTYSSSKQKRLTDS